MMCVFVYEMEKNNSKEKLEEETKKTFKLKQQLTTLHLQYFKVIQGT